MDIFIAVGTETSFSVTVGNTTFIRNVMKALFEYLEVVKRPRRTKNRRKIMKSKELLCLIPITERRNQTNHIILTVTKKN
jgi:hypothetical protein